MGFDTTWGGGSFFVSFIVSPGGFMLWAANCLKDSSVADFFILSFFGEETSGFCERMMIFFITKLSSDTCSFRDITTLSIAILLMAFYSDKFFNSRFFITPFIFSIPTISILAFWAIIFRTDRLSKPFS